MRRITATAVLLAVALGVGVAPALAKPFNGGSGSAPCGDGTLSWSPARVRPSNHKFVDVALSYEEASDDGDTVTLTVDSITHEEEGLEKGSTAKNEPDANGAGTSDTGVDAAPPAAADSAQVTVEVRAERLSKPKDGRTYTIAVTCSDAGDVSGTPGTGTAAATVTVLHSRKAK